MGERIAFGVVEGRIRLRAGTPRGGARRVRDNPVASLLTRVGAQRLISLPDAANSRDLREETQLMLSTLTDHERDVLRLRFGLGGIRHCSVEEIARRTARDSDDVSEIEAQALRNLRHPWGHLLRSAGRK
jgi:DNA-directed RNA polymerase sigma subunit (sigma70/sigma32)